MNYLRGIDTQRRDFERKLPAYLNGEWRDGGWWYYYLFALSMKVPLGTFALALLAFIGAFHRNRIATDELYVLVPAIAVVVLVSSQTGVNMGLRYLLPAFPFAFIWISRVAKPIPISRVTTYAVTGCLAWSVTSCLMIYPHVLSYFNEFAGGPQRGSQYLLDSNLDWGQDMIYLRKWYDEHPQAQPLGVAQYVPFIPPSVARITSTIPPIGPRPGSKTPLPDAERYGPRPGWYVMSVCKLQQWSGEYRYFEYFAPVDSVGYSFRVYDISLEDANRVRRQIGIPVLEFGGESEDVRLMGL